MTPFKVFRDLCCGWLGYAVADNLIWYDKYPREWCAGFFDNLDKQEETKVIRYCPFCGAKLEKPLTKE